MFIARKYSQAFFPQCVTPSCENGITRGLCVSCTHTHTHTHATHDNYFAPTITPSRSISHSSSSTKRELGVIPLRARARDENSSGSLIYISERSIPLIRISVSRGENHQRRYTHATHGGGSPFPQFVNYLARLPGRYPSTATS